MKPLLAAASCGETSPSSSLLLWKKQAVRVGIAGIGKMGLQSLPGFKRWGKL